MAKDKAWVLRYAIIGLLFMPLVFAFSAAKMDQMHLLSTSFPFQIQNARYLCLAVTLLSILAIPFMNRFGIKMPGNLREQRINPELVLLLLDMALLLFPTMCVLLLFFFGLPVNDVYFYSYPSFLIMLGWLFWKRHVFQFDDGDKSTLRPISPYIALKSYTMILLGLTALALFFLILKLILMINPPEEYIEPLFMNLPWAIIYASIVIGCSYTIVLRLRNSQHAFDVTALTSALVAYWIPFGTAVYLYWRFRIKQKEITAN